MYDHPVPPDRKRLQQQRAASAREQLQRLSRRPLRFSLARASADWSEKLFTISARLKALLFSWKNAPERMGVHGVVVALALLIIWCDKWERQPLPVANSVASTETVLFYVAAAESMPGLAAPTTPALSTKGKSRVDQITPAFQEPAAVISAFRSFHQIKPGETLGDIAQRYNIDLLSLLWTNGFEDGDLPALNQELRIPRITGAVYTTNEGDTLSSIAAQFTTSPAAIIAFSPNNLAATFSIDTPLPVGRELFVPASALPLPEQLTSIRGDLTQLAAIVARPTGMALESETNVRSGPSREHQKLFQLATGSRVQLLGQYKEWLKVEQRGRSGWVRADLLQTIAEQVTALPQITDFPAPPPRWVWPARGTITSGFGRRWGGFHNGLDIANRARTPIVAARSGYVKEAGWCRGYGYCVKIIHGDGLETHYGHLISRPVVGTGEEVAAGQLVGYMGSTYDRAGGGYSTGVHLHFTVLLNGKAVNPLLYLP
jgi:murein DD-endopeptidase MepM/ murein hydrolase activator NlpD